jgi:hypothetical protein
MSDTPIYDETVAALKFNPTLMDTNGVLYQFRWAAPKRKRDTRNGK